MSGGHGHGGGHHGENKQVALLIAVLALVLAFAETLGKAAQTEALSQNIEASNLWSFFQAKTIRMTVLRTAAESAGVQAAGHADPAVRAALDAQGAAWKATAARYDSEPETGEGRKQLAERAKAAEQRRARHMAAYHHYEVASGVLQIAIVLASSSIITGMVALVWAAAALGAVGGAFCLIGLLAPTAIHLF